jgi:hypothetical protein
MRSVHDGEAVREVVKEGVEHVARRSDGVCRAVFDLLAMSMGLPHGNPCPSVWEIQ